MQPNNDDQPGVNPPLTAGPGDSASATVSVHLCPEDAFDIFTREIDQWWRRGKRFRNAPGEGGILWMEPGVGGRVFESVGKARDAIVIQIGECLVWEPPTRLVFCWRNANFAPAESTQVEVVFVATHTGTQVSVTHSGWAQLPPDHPARHGLAANAVSRMVGMWWGDLLTALREHADERRDSGRSR